MKDARGQQAPTREVRATINGNLIYRGGRHVAAIRAGELCRTFDARREVFRGSLLFHNDVLELAARVGVQGILATERESGQVYRISMKDFTRLAWSYEHKAFGRQLGLELARWERLPRQGEPVQLSLFKAVR